MKRIAAVLLAALSLVFTVQGAWAEEFAPYGAVIANPQVADRLNVRKAPDAASASLGRFYSGTPVQVLRETQDKNGNVWAYIQVGDGAWDDAATVRGYVRREYLMPKNRNYGAPQWFVSAEPVNGHISLRSAPQSDAPAVGTLQNAVWVLGDVGDDWRYVMSRKGEGHGYVRTRQLKNKTVEIPNAFLTPSDGADGVALYADKELKRQTGFFYAGAPVRVVDFTRAGRVRVQSSGTLRARTEEGDDFVEGYVKASELTVFIQPWEVVLRTKTGYVLREISLPRSFGAIPQGAAVTVVGEYGGKYQVRYSTLGSAVDLCLLTDKENLRLSDLPGVTEGPAPLGYAYLPIPRDPEGYLEGFRQYYAPGGESEQQGFSSVCQVLSELADDWLQVRQFPENSFFVKREEGVKIVWTDGLEPASGEKSPGAWTAEKEEAGLWMFSGDHAVLRLKKAGSEDGESYAVGEDEKNASYTVYIPAGTKVTLEGEGVMIPFRRESAPILLGQNAQDIREDQPIFSGTGQFFCDGQIQTCHNYYDFRLRPVPGSTDSWFRIGNLFESPQEMQGGANEEDGEYAYVSLLPGDMIELHDCELYVFFGNG